MNLRMHAGHVYALFATSLIGLALLMLWPVLSTGFAVDDFAQLSMMRGEYPLPRPALQLFTFSNGEWLENVRLKTAGIWPWWTHPAFRLSLFRPLASSLMWLDLKCFGLNAFHYHLHSAVWWLFMMGCLAVVLRQLLMPAAALVALTLCVVHGSHIWFLGWIANRNAVVAGGFALLGISVLLQGSARNWWPRRGLAMACFAIALSAGEYAFGFLAYPLCHEFESQHAWRARASRALPWVAFAACYLALRAGLGFGSFGSGAYLDPFGEPGVFAQAALVRFPISVAELVFGVQADWWHVGFPWTRAWLQRGILPSDWGLEMHPMQLLQQVIGWCAVVLALWFLWTRWRTRSRRWLLIATPLALLPSLPGMTESRLLFPSLVGWSVVCAEALCDWILRARSDKPRWPCIAAALGVGLLVSFQLIGQLVSHRPRIHGLPMLAGAARRSILAPQLDEPLRNARRVLLLGAADQTTSIYLPLVRRVYQRPAPASYQLLSSHGGPQRLERLSTNGFVLERLDPRASPFDSYATSFNRVPIRTGDSFDAGPLQAVVARAHDGRPMRTVFQLDLPLEEPNVLLLQQTSRGLRPIHFPAVGESMLVDPPVPPFELVHAP